MSVTRPLDGTDTGETGRSLSFCDMSTANTMGDRIAEFTGYHNSLTAMAADISGRTATRTPGGMLDLSRTVGHGAHAGACASAVIVGTKNGTNATEVSRSLRTSLGDMAANIKAELGAAKVRRAT